MQFENILLARRKLLEALGYREKIGADINELQAGDNQEIIKDAIKWLDIGKDKVDDIFNYLSNIEIDRKEANNENY